MNNMLHGKRFLKQLTCCALLLCCFAATSPQASAAAPGGVFLNSPGDGATLNAPAATQFAWSESSPAADWYYVWVGKEGSTYMSKWFSTNSFTVANGLPGGNYSWWVQTWNNSDGFGPWSGPSSFSVVGAIPGFVNPISPVNTLETSNTIDYSWSQDLNSTWYELYIHKDGSFFKNQWFGPSDFTLSANTVTVPVNDHTSGAYSWWVRPWGPDGLGEWSSTASFTVQANGEPGAVTLISPGNNATPPTQTTLEWSQTDPASEWFWVYMNKDGQPFFSQWFQTNSHTFENGLSSGTYTWWVRPWNSAGLGPWSTFSSFTVIGGIPTNILPVSPLGNATLTGTNVNYVWTDDPGAVWFQLLVNHNTQPFLNRWFNARDVSFVNSTQRTVTIPDQPSGNYAWWVRGWSPDGFGDWTPTSTFTLTGP
jgi:hypothetical protein